MNLIPIKTTCNACGGEGYLSTGNTVTLTGHVHSQLSPCEACEGKGTQIAWLDVHQLATLLHAITAEEQAQ